MPDEIKSPTAPPGCAPTSGSEVPSPRADALENRWNRQLVPLTQEGVNLFREMEHELFAANAELDAIRAVFQHGADEENWKPGTSLAEAVAKLKVAAGIPNDEDQRRRDREASSATET